MWASRLRTADFTDDMGFTPSAASEIPHVNGLPVPLPISRGVTVVREWPNLAGRLEPADDADIVRWCRSLAPPPSRGTVMARGETVHHRLRSEMRQWLTRFARALTQIKGVSLAAPSETPRLILLTPGTPLHGVELPRGIERTPARLAEFPGGMVLTMDRRSFEHRTQYADAVEAIIRGAVS